VDIPIIAVPIPAKINAISLLRIIPIKMAVITRDIPIINPIL
jgi:hypothetical protein